MRRAKVHLVDRSRISLDFDGWMVTTDGTLQFGGTDDKATAVFNKHSWVWVELGKPKKEV